MGILSGIVVSVCVVIGVTFGSPAILGWVGLTQLGPVAGGLFASAQGTAIVAGSWMAAAQAIAMATISPTP